MKLLMTPTSPYARKVRVLLTEKNIRCEEAVSVPWDDDPELLRHNPLRKVPVLITDDAGVLRGSAVIAEYLEAHTPTPSFVPAAGAARFAVLDRERLAEGGLDAATALLMAGRVAPDAANNDGWVQWQLQKVTRTLAYFENDIATRPADAFDLSDVTLACWLFFLARLPHIQGWENSHPQLAKWRDTVAARESVTRTAPPCPPKPPLPAADGI